MVTKQDLKNRLPKEDYEIRGSQIYSKENEGLRYLAEIGANGKIKIDWESTHREDNLEKMARLRADAKKYSLPLEDNRTFRENVAGDLTFRISKLEPQIEKLKRIRALLLEG
jgi:hypothetical protein